MEIYFCNTSYTILTDNWYESKKQNVEEERLRIVKAAADIIREDIRSMVNNLHTYPTPETILDNIKMMFRIHFKCFWIQFKKKKKNLYNDEDKYKTTTLSIAHSIIAATRPRSFFFNTNWSWNIDIQKIWIILNKYVNYVKLYYKNGATVVFDEYTDDATKSTKSAKWYQRAIRYGAAKVLFDVTLCITMFKSNSFSMILTNNVLYFFYGKRLKIKILLWSKLSKMLILS